KDEKGGRRVSILCYLEERGVVENDTSGVSCSSILERSRDRDDQRTCRAVLPVKSRHTGAVIANPDCTICGGGHAPGINKVFIDVLRYTGDVRLEVYPRIGIRAHRRGCQYRYCEQEQSGFGIKISCFHLFGRRIEKVTDLLLLPNPLYECCSRLATSGKCCL